MLAIDAIVGNVDSKTLATQSLSQCVSKSSIIFYDQDTQFGRLCFTLY